MGTQESWDQREHRAREEAIKTTRLIWYFQTREVLLRLHLADLQGMRPIIFPAEFERERYQTELARIDAMHPEEIRRRTYSDGELEFDSARYVTDAEEMIRMCMEAAINLKERQSALCFVLDVDASVLEEEVVKTGTDLPVLHFFDFEFD